MFSLNYVNMHNIKHMVPDPKNIYIHHTLHYYLYDDYMYLKLVQD